ncbi:RHS repeat-associated core domain-containing protein [candidate division WOR-3 bacterium]|nr:RHS repeat-associated core domain-containing protein [candidate division WOR-3 bacterium]
MTDGSGLSPVERSYFYDEFGNSLGSWGSISNHYLYTGQEYDGEISSLHNLRARYYDRSIGRFISEDPVWQNTVYFNRFGFFCKDFLSPQDFNPYLYVSNNSVNMIDPTGLKKYYGYWCGDKWMGGKEMYFEDMQPSDFKTLEEFWDDLDRCCMEHDSHIWYCRFMRDQGIFDEEKYRQCENEADRNLSACFNKVDPRSLGLGGKAVRAFGIPFFRLRGRF